MKKAASLLLIACMLLAAVPAGAYLPDAQVGMDVCGFSSTTPDGAFINGYVFTQYGSSVVTYWATWNEDCVAQMDLLQKVHKNHPEYGVFGLLHVDATSTAEAALELIDSKGYTFPIILIDSVWQEVIDKAPFIPQTFIVSRSGIITEVWHAAFDSTATILTALGNWYDVSLVDGDADLNGKITVNDALLVIRIAMRIKTGNHLNLAHGDMNCNGKLDVSDALKILRMAMGIETAQ